MHLMPLKDVFPNHGENIIPNCTNETTLRNVEQVQYVKLTSHQVFQVDRHSTVGQH